MYVTTNPTTENCKNIRDYLTPTEVTILIDAVKKKGGWYAYRNATLILIMYRHGLRRSEASHLSERSVSHIVHQAGILAKFDFPVHAHLLRHACGYYLANKGIDTRTIQDYLGHSNIQNTVRYTQLSSSRFEGLWD